MSPLNPKRRLRRLAPWLGAAGALLALALWPGQQTPVGPEAALRARQTRPVPAFAEVPLQASRESSRPLAEAALPLPPAWDVAQIIAPFSALRQKALPNRHEQQELRKLLSDRQAIARIRDELLYAAGPSFSLDAEQERLGMVSFLEQAVSWKENPARPEVLAGVFQIVSSSSYHQLAHDPRLQRSLLGDKQELLAALSASEPTLAAKLVAQGLQGQNRKFFLYLLGKPE